jgi:hypothetical protein
VILAFSNFRERLKGGWKYDFWEQYLNLTGCTGVQNGVVARISNNI